VTWLALRKPHRRNFPVRRFAADFSETDRAHQTSRNAPPAGAVSKRIVAPGTHTQRSRFFSKNSASNLPVNELQFFERRFPTDSRQGVSRDTFPVIPDFSVVSFSPCGAKR
jgi:hypothetical protein